MIIQAFRLLCLICVICVICGSTIAGEKPQHAGTKLEGFATVVTSHSITIFSKKNRTIEIQTGKDYSALVGIAAPVTVWYTTKDGVNLLEDIVYPTRAAEFVPPDLIRERIKRIVILAKPEGVENSDGLVKAISEYLAQNTGWYVAPPELAAEIASRDRGPDPSPDGTDPNSGQADIETHLELRRAQMISIANATRSDAVLEIRIEKVKANVHAGIAKWNDIAEPVASRAARSLTPWEGMMAGWVYAATANMNLWTNSGQLLWKKRRGFAVLGVQSGIGGKYHERPLKELYDDPEWMQRWLVDTLGQLAPPTGARGKQ